METTNQINPSKISKKASTENRQTRKSSFCKGRGKLRNKRRLPSSFIRVTIIARSKKLRRNNLKMFRITRTKMVPKTNLKSRSGKN